MLLLLIIIIIIIIKVLWFHFIKNKLTEIIQGDN